MRLVKVISGGQTGVDRAALDAALRCGFPIGGWCPRGRRSEDGAIPHAYPMAETTTSHYPERTTWNVRDSDATLVVTSGGLDAGSQFATREAAKLGRPYWVVDVNERNAPELALAFIRKTNTRVLNVAGPRESNNPGIHALALEFLTLVFARADQEAAALASRPLSNRAEA